MELTGYVATTVYVGVSDTIRHDIINLCTFPNNAMSVQRISVIMFFS